MNFRENDAVAAFRQGDLERARSLTQEQLTAEPDAPQLQHLMGLILCRTGELERGIEWLRRATEAEPENIAYRVMLTRALADSGRAREALNIARAPTGTSPAELALWHARAEAATAAEAWEDSAEAWARLCAVSGDWRAWSNYGHALTALGRWAQASVAFKRALELNPGEVSLRRSLATVLARAGKYEESADELARWVDAVPENAEARLAFARLLADLGRHEEAMAQLHHAAELTTGAPAFLDSAEALIRIARPQNGVAVAENEFDLGILRELALLLERMSRLNLLSDLLNEAESHGIRREHMGYPAAAAALRGGDAAEARRLLLNVPAENDPTRWHWLMARIADALGEPDDAFAEAEAMNRAANDYNAWRGRAAQYLDWVRSLGTLLTPEWGSRLPRLSADERRSPAFLVGFPRSGTTLLDTFLMGHADAAVLEEQPTISVVEQVLGDVAALPKCSTLQLEEARRAYFGEVDRHVEPGFDGLVIDKMPLNMLALPFIHCLFPNARIIFAQRHPCDCVLSCFMQGFALNNAMACFLDIQDSAALYDAAMSVWARSCEILPLKTQTVTYEQLVADPKAALRPALEFLGLEWRDELLDHRVTAQVRGVIATPSYGQVTEPLSDKASGRWRRYEKQLEPVLPVLMPWAERLGYSA